MTLAAINHLGLTNSTYALYGRLLLLDSGALMPNLLEGVDALGVIDMSGGFTPSSDLDRVGLQVVADGLHVVPNVHQRIQSRSVEHVL